MALTLTSDERTELERRLRSLKIRAEDARLARVILMLADETSYSTIEATVQCYRDYINRWRRRLPAQRLAGLRSLLLQRVRSISLSGASAGRLLGSRGMTRSDFDTW
jgi:hypothetical protein